MEHTKEIIAIGKTSVHAKNNQIPYTRAFCSASPVCFEDFCKTHVAIQKIFL